MTNGDYFSGKVAVVTGAGSGVGRATALALADRGMIVVILGREPGPLLETARINTGSASMITVQCDVRSEESAMNAFQSISKDVGDVDTLVLSAGIEIRGRIENYSIQEWNDTLHTNLTGPYLCTRSAIPLLKRSDSGSIIAIASGAAKQGYAELGAYCASKFGLLGLMESLADELSPDGIRVSTILPGSIMTPFGGKSVEEKQALASEGKKYIQPEDVARSIVHLLETPDGAWTQEMNLWPF